MSLGSNVNLLVVLVPRSNKKYMLPMPQLGCKGSAGSLPSNAPDFLALLAFGVPKILIRILFVLIAEHAGLAETTTLVAMIEMFAGAMEITKAFQRIGYSALPYEIDFTSAWMDFITPQG